MFLKNLIKLASGNLIAQAISFGAMPIITRLYSTEEFGVFAIYLSLTMVAFPLANLRFSSAILLPDNDRDAAALLLAALGATLLLSFTAIPLLVWFLGFAEIYELSVQKLLWLMVIGVLVQSTTQCLQFWQLRLKRFGVMGQGAIAESVVDRSVVIGSASHGFGSYSLVAGRIVGPLAQLLWLLRGGGVGSFRACLPVSVSDVKAQMSRYYRFPLYSTWALLFGNGARELPTALLAILFSPAVVGAYALGMRVMSWPMLMVGDAIAKSYFRRIAETIKDPVQTVAETYLAIRFTAYLMMPPMMVLVALGPPLFTWVFGAEWEQAGRFVQILAAVYFFTFQYRVISTLFEVLERQQLALGLNALLFLARGSGLWLGAQAGGVTGAITGLLAGSLVSYGIAYCCIMSLLKQEPWKWLRPILIALVMLSPFAAASYLAYCVFERSHLAAISIIISAWLVQLLIITWREPVLYDIAQKLRRKITKK